MIVEHILTDIDSLQSLALTYLGDATRGGEIADYNKLNYPYILQDREELNDYFGSGYIAIVRSNSQTSTLIKKGWTFKTKSSLFTGNTTRVFGVIEDTLVPAGEQTYEIPLRCTVPGNFGNVMAGTVTEVGDDTLQLSDIQFLSITNELNFSGGKPIDVRVTGDTLYIPTDYSEVAPENIEKILDLIGGEDLVLDDYGNLVIEDGGDLASVHGSDNIRYAVISRLQTELGDLLHHPEYGTDFQELIGSPNIANREKLMEIAIYRSLVQESRITNVSVDNMTIDGTTINLNISYNVAINGMPDQITLVL